MNNTNTKKLDPILILILILMSSISLVSIYSAMPLISSNYSATFILLKQAAWVIMGFSIMLILFYLGVDRFDTVIHIVYYILLASLILLIIQAKLDLPFLRKFIRQTNYSYCWYTIPGIGTIQPSEFMKMILLIIVANTIENHHRLYPRNTFQTDFRLILTVLKYVIPPCFFIYIEPDSGVTLIILFSIVFMMICSGIKHEWIYIGIGAVVFIIAFFGVLYILNPEFVVQKIIGGQYKLNRILGWLYPEEYMLSHGNQLYKSLLAIGSAGTDGYGLQNIPISVPEAQTDFIFAVIAATFGLKGSIFVVVLCLMLDIRLFYIGYRTKRNRNKYIIAGLLGILTFQQIVNIGMITGLLPITGITLPFISAGGSSMISYMMILAYVLQMGNEFEQKVEKNDTYNMINLHLNELNKKVQ